ncbi:UNVERIFIED_ORG: hypothetical protein M2438_002567 [Methylobacterium sp. SuP10 SLI 274]|nr:hypothetical protein [Methylorubrum extorquens]MDF9792108.1 hypothetical protein [Methylorubrum extorquens]MDF9863793.1 hypothetical protein [Methylorubrum pseudosasae]MDH6637392.1 hypothetical protein [Methylobacterium sp. SuP10 SLI 274]MDH6666572.1 hypothetical protein [Methylorubrum zatmanii]
MGASSLRRVAGLAGVEQRPRLDLQRDCWRRLRHWRRSVRSTGAGGASGRCPSSRPKREALPAARTQRTGRCGHEAPPRHRRVRHAARPEANGCQPAWRPAVGVPSMPCRCAAGDHRPTVRRPRPAVRCPPGCHKRVQLPSDPKVPRSMLANRRAWPSAVRRQARAARGLGVGRNASTGRLRRVRPDWSPPATPGLLRHDKAARSHACRHLRRSVRRRNRAAWSAERSALAS